VAQPHRTSLLDSAKISTFSYNTAKITSMAGGVKKRMQRFVMGLAIKG